MGRGGMALGNGQRQGRAFGLACLMAMGALMLVLSACTPIFTNHGYMPSEQDLALLQVGVDTRDTVEATIGRPAAEGLLGEEAWYYVQSRWKALGAREPQEVSREVLAVSFDADGKVANIERFGLDKGEIVSISRRITTTNIRGKGILRQILGNIGKLDTSKIIQ
jgi:outer membrane protein assembly factor BamE (lipoprotein component of BamABCDE complex)